MLARALYSPGLGGLWANAGISIDNLTAEFALIRTALKVAKIAWVLLGASPVLCWLALLLFPRCKVTEAGPSKCLVAGADIGDLLHALGDYITLWAYTGVVTITVWVVVLMIILSTESNLSESVKDD
ncbi:hypothetical protein ASE94_01705 [Devosia sp. Leaf64]|nr:hypothetical protein ASE94_01705 [Devosia sp. Leaf64]